MGPASNVYFNVYFMDSPLSLALLRLIPVRTVRSIAGFYVPTPLRDISACLLVS